MFVAKLDYLGGYLWAKRFGDALDQAGTAIVTDGASNVIVTGTVKGSVDFGGGWMLQSAGGQDIFVAKFSPLAGKRRG